MTTLVTDLRTAQPSKTFDVAHGPQLINQLLADSQELTAVEQFAKSSNADHHPAQAKYYHSLLPSTAPEAGQQYAFEVDLDLCSGCKACVTACHNMNGLEATEAWRSVGMLNGDNGLPVLQHVTTACHHCVEPGCLSGCPTNAYEKDPETGIVRHLDDQCFGCQYCTMACPYEVPQYSAEKGIVRKCDMCQGRLAAGEAPACVQACPNQAIRISVVDVAVARRHAFDGGLLPDAPPSNLTIPTTIYRTTRNLPEDLQAADESRLQVQHAHLPLVAMLVLTQLSVGGIAFGAALRWIGESNVGAITTLAAVVAGFAGLALAPLHLGRPHLAFRSVLGWRHSWLSREAILFGLYAPLMLLLSTLCVTERFELPILNDLDQLAGSWRVIAEGVAVLVGSLGVYCSIRIYQFTGRVFWQGSRTGGKFFGTAIVLGLATVLSAATLIEASTTTSVSTWPIVVLLMASVLAKLLYETLALSGTADERHSLQKTAKILSSELIHLVRVRYACCLVGGIALPLMVGMNSHDSLLSVTLSIVANVLLLIGELVERTLYFAAVVPLRMPGGIRP